MHSSHYCSFRSLHKINKRAERIPPSRVANMVFLRETAIDDRTAIKAVAVIYRYSDGQKSFERDCRFCSLNVYLDPVVYTIFHPNSNKECALKLN